MALAVTVVVTVAVVVAVVTGRARLELVAWESQRASTARRDSPATTPLSAETTEKATAARARRDVLKESMLKSGVKKRDEGRMRRAVTRFHLLECNNTLCSKEAGQRRIQPSRRKGFATWRGGRSRLDQLICGRFDIPCPPSRESRGSDVLCAARSMRRGYGPRCCSNPDSESRP